MSKNRKKVVFILLVICIACFFTGCMKQKEESVEITFIHGWGSTETDHVAMRQIYQEFEKKHPEIKVNMIAMPSSTDVISKVKDLLVVGNIPDIVFTGGEGRESVYSYMVNEGYAIDLNPYLKADKEFAQNVSEVIKDYWTTKDGRLYTVSDVLLMGGYWYNEDIFGKAGILTVPKTWEEWLIACEKIEALEEEVVPVILDADHLAYLMTVLLADENVKELQNIKEKGIDVNSVALENMMERLREITGHAIFAENYNYRDTLAEFNAGGSAIYFNGVWANSMIDSELNVSYASFPSKEGEGIATQSACVGYLLGNTGEEKRIKASIEFLKYMLSEEVAYKILQQTGQVPSNPKVEITVENSGERLRQAVKCVQEAGIVIETPENIWDLSKKEQYRKNILLFLQNEITKQELGERLTTK